MFNNYLKVAFRNLLRQKTFSVINIVGLAIGISVCLIIFLWIKEEYSYDSFYPDAKNLYRTVSGSSSCMPTALANELETRYPEIINAVRFDPWRSSWQLKYNDKTFLKKCALTDPAFFNMFSVEFLTGNKDTAFNDKFSIVLTESVAKQIFQEEEALGKVIKVRGFLNLTVTGIIEDLPSNTQFNYTTLIPFDLFSEWRDDHFTWQNSWINTYIQIKDGVSEEEIEQKISNLLIDYKPLHKKTLELQPVSDIHLHDLGGGGLISYIYIFSVLGIFLLLISCINFMNLTTARSVNRIKEVGLRKIIGAGKKELIKQFYMESIVTIVISLAFSMVLVELFLPLFNDIAGSGISLVSVDSFKLFAIISVVTILTAIIAGSYPSIFMSSINPIMTLRGNLASRKGKMFRSVLVVFQFSISLILLISFLVINRQFNFILNHNLGYDRENILNFQLRPTLARKYPLLIEELEKLPEVISHSVSNTTPNRKESDTTKIFWEGKEEDQEINFSIIATDFGYLETFGLEMAQGRFFSDEYSTDIRTAFIINETAVKVLGYEEPLGKEFSHAGFSGVIIGVIKDFNHRTVHYGYDPVVMQIIPGWMDNLSIRIQPGNMKQTVEKIKAVFEDAAPEYSFEFEIFDEEINHQYVSEMRMTKIFKNITILALFISVLGIFGMSLYNAERRKKEIGIRKVLGSSVIKIMSLLSKDYLKLVIISNYIAWPAAYLLMNKWLQNFAFKAKMDMNLFILSGIFTLLIALITISVQIYRSADSNLIAALKYE